MCYQFVANYLDLLIENWYTGEAITTPTSSFSGSGLLLSRNSTTTRDSDCCSLLLELLASPTRDSRRSEAATDRGSSASRSGESQVACQELTRVSTGSTCLHTLPSKLSTRNFSWLWRNHRALELNNGGSLIWSRNQQQHLGEQLDKRTDGRKASSSYRNKTKQFIQAQTLVAPFVNSSRDIKILLLSLLWWWPRHTHIIYTQTHTAISLPIVTNC